MRKNESESVVKVFQNQLHANLIYVDATERFLSKLEGIDFLGQSTIYPEIIESGTKTAKMVKPHHNVSGLRRSLS